MKMLYEVDNQIDFYEGGALAVPDSNKIKPNIETLIKAAYGKIPVVGSIDCHTVDDPEFNVFPPHCIDGTNGYLKINESISSPYTSIPRHEIWEYKIDNIGIVLEKATYDIWDATLGAPESLDNILKHHKIDTVYVCGLALDICVAAAIRGFLSRHLAVYLVEDATQYLNKEAADKFLVEFKDQGGIVIKTQDVRF